MTPVVCTHRKSYLFVIHSYFSWCVTTACFSWHLGVSRTSRESDPQKVPVWRHTNSESLGNRCMWKFSEDIFFSHILYFFFLVSLYVCSGYKLYQTTATKFQLWLFLFFSPFQQLRIHHLLMNGETANYLAEHTAPPEIHKPLLKLYRHLHDLLKK